MALKHLIEYYNKVCKDREEAIKTIREFEIECNNNLVDPERVEKLKSNLQPLMDNYEQISYLMFLLNKPNKKNKESKYINQNQKFLSQIKSKNTTEAAVLKNKEVLNKLKEL